MPLPFHSYGLAYQSALASIRSEGTGADIGEIARNLASKYPSGQNDPYVYYLNIVQAADRNWRQSTAMEAEPGAVHAGRSVPIDPSIGPGSELYAYRVVVVANHTDGTKTETLTVVRSDVPLAGEHVQALAIEAVGEGIQESSSNPRGLRGPTVTDYQAVIVGAGRRR